MTTMVTNKNGIEFDIDTLATDVNGKMDRDGLNALASVCVESYQNGSSWYRVYSNGWCEQGGYSSDATDYALDYALLSVSLLKAYKDTNYTLTITTACNNGTNNVTVPMVMVGYTEKFTSYFTRRISVSPYRAGVSWYACGYIR